MEIFCLLGYENQRITLELNEVLGYPDETSYDGGYDIICTLFICIGCYQIEQNRYYSATGALYRFSDELKRCYKDLEGQAEYRLLLEDDLIFKINMTSFGHAIVTGTYQERTDKDNIFTFEMETDQTCLLPVINGIEELKRIYGGMKGINQTM